MENTAPHPTPRHRSVCHATTRAIAPAWMPRAHERGGRVERGARGQQRTDHSPVRRAATAGAAPRKSERELGDLGTDACPCRDRRPSRRSARAASASSGAGQLRQGADAEPRSRPESCAPRAQHASSRAEQQQPQPHRTGEG